MLEAYHGRLPELNVKPWVEPAHEPFYIVNATIIDPAKGKLMDGAQVIKVEKGIIASVSNANSAKLEEGVKTVDAQGGYVCPGLIDAHVHVCAVPGVSVSHYVNDSTDC
jgi:adenine deaminase